MKKINNAFKGLFLCSLSSISFLTGCNSKPNDSLEFYRDIDINDNWDFKLENDVNFKNIDLPYDYSIKQEFDSNCEAESGYLKGGKAIYRKNLVVPYSNKRVILDLDGAYQDSIIKVNDKKIGENHFGYNPFAFDLTSYLTCDGKTNNVIEIETNNEIPTSRFYSGSGIYRDVKISYINNVSIKHNSAVITTPRIQYGEGIVNIKIDVHNYFSHDCDVNLEHTIVNSTGKEVASIKTNKQKIVSNNDGTFIDKVTIEDPLLWDDKNPNLYYVKTKVFYNDEVYDEVSNRFGFRYFTFNNQGFVINGKSVKLKGVCLHHDQGALGADSYNDSFVRQLTKLKDMGVNAIRTTHYPFDSKFMKLCDEMGFYVVEEIYDMWLDPKNGNTNDFSKYFDVKLTDDNNIMDGNSSMKWSEFALKETLKRDRNNPSIIMWSLGNEIGASNEKYLDAIRNLIKWSKEVDLTRPCTTGDRYRTLNPDTLNGQMAHILHNEGGVIGYNYPHANNAEEAFAAFGSFYGSETVSGLTSRSSYKTLDSDTTKKNWQDDPDKDHSFPNGAAVDFDIPSYDGSRGNVATQKSNLQEVLSKDYFAGHFVWTGFDYIGEPAPWNNTSRGQYVKGLNCAPNSAYYGQIDTAGFNKDNFYMYRSQYIHDQFTLHLCGSFNSENQYVVNDINSKHNGMTPVAIYSNCDDVRLYLVEEGQEPDIKKETNLIGWASSKKNVSAAGHTLMQYTFKVKEGHEEDCSMVSETDKTETNMYLRYYVKPKPNHYLAVVGFDVQDNVIKSTTGIKELHQPSNKLGDLKVNVSNDKLTADGHSLSFIELELDDENGNYINYSNRIDSHHLNFELEGEAIIAGVDNGRQNEINKFQAKSVLSDDRKTANIQAFGGKALIILKSTHNAGNIKLKITNNDKTINKTIELESNKKVLN